MTSVATEAEQAGEINLTFSNLWKQIRKSPEALVGFGILLAVIVGAVFAPWIAPYNPTALNLKEVLLPPSLSHLMGTDNFGRDIFSRVLYGGRLDLLIAFAVVAIAAPIGSLIGVLSGYRGGGVDEALMRVTDVFLAFPTIILAFTTAAVLGRTSLLNVIVALVITFWAPYARLARGQALHVKKELYIESAKAIGSSDRRIMIRQVFPMVSPVVLVHAALQSSAAILTIASLGFLGIGAQPPSPEWGLMIYGGLDYLTTNYWVSLFPGLAIVVTALAFNLIGDSVRDILDVRSSERR